MKLYIKNGKIKGRNQIVIKGQRTIKDKDGNDKAVETNIYNPTEKMILADGWMEYTIPEPSEEQVLENLKRDKLKELEYFDTSSEVNDCIIVKEGQKLHYWASKTDRDSLKGVVRDYISLGKEEYRLDLRDLEVYILIPCELLLSMLAQLEVYAAECYNRTTDHIFAINQLTTVEEIENYDFKTGYPAKLTFEV